jgi:hypothetical protein
LLIYLLRGNQTQKKQIKEKKREEKGYKKEKQKARNSRLYNLFTYICISEKTGKKKEERGKKRKALFFEF